MPEPSSLQSLFASAVEIANDDQREAFRVAACGDDVALRCELKRLITAHLDNPSYMACPVADLAAIGLLISVGERPGDLIGPYRLLEQIGEGGMGLVFMAEQIRPLRRRVALKIIKPGLDTRAVIARFEAERQALALMEHPNIARVYDAGATDSGRPYFAMELVRGAPITEYCRDENLSIGQRLKLFIEVCEAVQHAHQKGVIHRDLKPTNILVTQNDVAPVPKVIDFGVAKATGQQLTDRTLFTGYAQIIGTPLYMSPEQAELRNQDVDTRSDVYSLGVVMYELLTGTTPFDAERLKSAGADEMRRIIREEEPPKPSTRATTEAAALSTVTSKALVRGAVDVSALRGDLDWIVMKALEKDRRRRYESPSALAADVARHLANEPVEACPPTQRYRIAKFVRRNRAGLAVVTSIGVALLAGSGASLYQAVRATNAEIAKTSALAQKGLALQQARQAVDDMYTKVAEEWLADQGELTDVQRELLESAVALYESFSNENASDPDVQYEALEALSRVGAIRERLGQAESAQSAFEQVISKSTALAQRHHDCVEFPISRISARAGLTKILRKLDQVDECNAELALAVQEISSIDLGQIPDARLREKWAVALATLAGELTFAGRGNDAEATIQASLAAWQGLVDESPSDFNYRYGLAAGYARLGMRQMWWGSTDGKAETSLREADAQLTKMLDERPEDKKCRESRVNVLLNLGMVCRWQERHLEALDIDRQAVQTAAKLADEFPNEVSIQTCYASSLGNLAASLDKTQPDQPAEGDELVRKSLEVRERLVKRFPADVDHCTTYLSNLEAMTLRLLREGKTEDVERLRATATDSVSAITRLHKGNPNLSSQVATYLSIIAAQLLEQGEHLGAVECLESYPPLARQFQADGFLLPDHAPDQHVGIKVEGYYQRSSMLLTPVALLKRCADLAREDAGLIDAKRAELVGRYTTLAKQFRHEGNLALDAWVKSLAPAEDAGFRVAFHGEKLVNDWVVNRGAPSGIDSVPAQLRAAYCWVDGLMLRRLTQAARKEMAQQPTQHYVAQMLSAAPEALRDVDLALEIARRSIELAPDDEEARKSLAWALFRTGQWQACVDAIPHAEAIASGTIADDSEPHSILAMALWHTGRRDQALALQEHAAERLDAYERREKEKESRGYVVMPPTSMLRRLHEEAEGFLNAENPSVPGEDGQPSSTGNGPT